jgi:alkylation response protein AidB-like acyl-CoA dehydrogenase
MRFELTEDQRDFAASLDALILASDPVAVARAWADGDTAPGLKLWTRLAEQGVNALLVPEEDDGMGATPVELAIGFEVLGRHAVPGPWIESVAYLPRIVDGPGRARLASGQVGTVAVPGLTPGRLALDADVADLVVLAEEGARTAAVAGPGPRSVDRTRRLFEVAATPDATELAGGPLWCARNLAILAAAAHLLGAGERVLADSVTYVKQRRQFGREIGSYQAVKHALADVRIALDFARPVLHGAALLPSSGSVAAAKIACGDAAYLASRTGLQVHGAIGYTAEFDLSIWLNRIRALLSTWGTPSALRAGLLDQIGDGPILPGGF